MKMRLALSVAIVPLPSFIKIIIYRFFFGYSIGCGVKIGFSAIAVRRCTISDNARIGSFNLFYHTEELIIGKNAKFGYFNRVIGGKVASFGSGSFIDRFNEINSILSPVVLNSNDPVLLIGDGSVITVNHKIDFTDRVEFGDNVVFAGRNSNIWTHNRQKSGPVSIGRNCYIGANAQFVAHSSVGDYCVVGLGSIVTKQLTENWKLIGGVPARIIKDLDEDSKILVTYPTRPDIHECV